MTEEKKLSRAEILANARAAKKEKREFAEANGLKLPNKRTDEEYKRRVDVWIQAYMSAMVSCGVDHPSKTTKCVALATQAVADYEKAATELLVFGADIT